MPWHKVIPVVDVSLIQLCAYPYPGHRKGCPNINKAGCPPTVPVITKTLDFSQPIYAVWNVFDFGAYMRNARKTRPRATEPQLRCCLYWQKGARNRMWDEIGRFEDQYGFGWEIVAAPTHSCPEAQGVNVFATMERIGEILERRPETKAYQVALVGKRKENDEHRIIEKMDSSPIIEVGEPY